MPSAAPSGRERSARSAGIRHNGILIPGIRQPWRSYIRQLLFDHHFLRGEQSCPGMLTCQPSILSIPLRPHGLDAAAVFFYGLAKVRTNSTGKKFPETLQSVGLYGFLQSPAESAIGSRRDSWLPLAEALCRMLPKNEPYENRYYPRRESPARFQSATCAFSMCLSDEKLRP